MWTKGLFSWCVFSPIISLLGFYIMGVDLYEIQFHRFFPGFLLLVAGHLILYSKAFDGK